MLETKAIKPNIATTMISKPSIAIVIETHSEVDIVAIEVDN